MRVVSNHALSLIIVAMLFLADCGIAETRGATGPTDTARYRPSAETGAPPEMKRLAALVGNWTTTASFIDLEDFEGAWVPTSAQRASCRGLHDGAFVYCEMDTLFPAGNMWRTVAVYSFDRYQGKYRVGFLDDQWALFDVYEGIFEGDTLRADNRATGTFGPGGLNGEFIPAGFELIAPEPGEDTFTFTWMTDFGGITHWRPAIRIEFVRKGDN